MIYYKSNGARQRHLPGQNSVKGILFLLPMLTFAVIFVFYPFGQALVQSVSVVDFRGEITGFAGLDHFRYLFGRKEFSSALRNTLLLCGVNVPVTVVLTLLLAWMCRQKSPFHSIMETAFALPMSVSMASISLVFKVLLNPTAGYLNYITGLDIRWLTDRRTAMYGILIITIWMGIAFNFLLFLSALRAIPGELAESAALEGASSLRIFMQIQLPLLSPTLLYVVCTNMIQALMTNGPILILTGGGPARSTTTMIYLMYSTGFSSSNYSLAACVSIIAFLMTLTFTLLLFTTEKGRVHYQ